MKYFTTNQFESHHSKHLSELNNTKLASKLGKYNVPKMLSQHFYYHCGLCQVLLDSKLHMNFIFIKCYLKTITMIVESLSQIIYLFLNILYSQFY